MQRETWGQREGAHSQQEAGLMDGDLSGGWGEKKKDLPRNRKLKGIRTARDEAEELDGGLVKGRVQGSRRPVALSQPQGQ